MNTTPDAGIPSQARMDICIEYDVPPPPYQRDYPI
jgi:hypothetical protein